ncbi:MAG: hypothetical protein QOI76_1784 [Frankiales bacterium]|jgi:hypothetical protein|nr:hypothetical protein [Frankiales bacterium]MEA2668367.1 hypothetical protein [Chloroflexota bacterium]
MCNDEVGHSGHVNAIGVDQLAVKDIPSQRYEATVPAGDRLEKWTREPDAVLSQTHHILGGDERRSVPDLDDHTHQRGVGLALIPMDDEVGKGAHVRLVAVLDCSSDEPRDRDQPGRPERPS